jgi:hypothetical protein
MLREASAKLRSWTEAQQAKTAERSTGQVKRLTTKKG